ncbi:ABC transporter ATP-binding protein [Limnospira platensis CENA597]|uniref:ABC transporter ATP-binding protein n=1 Tax=Limnospira platensis TaxID=118562 RepID=UPI003D6FA1F5
MSESAILDMVGISKQYPNTNTPAVEDISITLNHGDILGLLGPSGCGKTTLLRIIAGFEQPDRGVVEIAGQVVSGSKEWIPPERRGVGMVFQNYALFPHLTVAQNIAFGLEILRKKSPKQLQLRVAEVLELVGLSGYADRYPHEISGGQQQRVALARALAPGPTLVLLDEPLSNLDVQVRLKLRQELRQILKAARASAVFVTHDQEEALSISDWVAVMRHGHLEQWGTPEKIYLEPASRFVAEFVTQANFIPAQRRGNLWETEVGCFAIASNDGDDSDITEKADLMVRQEDFILKPDETASVVIRDRQFLGRELHYCLQVPSGGELIARTPFGGRSLPVGMRVQVMFPQDSVRVFPAVSGSETRTSAYVSAPH